MQKILNNFYLMLSYIATTETFYNDYKSFAFIDNWKLDEVSVSSFFLEHPVQAYSNHSSDFGSF